MKTTKTMQKRINDPNTIVLADTASLQGRNWRRCFSVEVYVCELLKNGNRKVWYRSMTDSGVRQWSTQIGFPFLDRNDDYDCDERNWNDGSYLDANEYGKNKFNALTKWFSGHGVERI